MRATPFDWDAIKRELTTAFDVWYNAVCHEGKTRQFDTKQDLVARIREWAGSDQKKLDKCHKLLDALLEDRFGKEE